mmetsp:Transcript_3791/g.8375  ORF Transcript_3791/g.8375 Transcript_3791/m.8375 type:complete len:82 (+) Transcript_3791:1793-2038(+)
MRSSSDIKTAMNLKKRYIRCKDVLSEEGATSDDVADISIAAADIDEAKDTPEFSTSAALVVVSSEVAQLGFETSIVRSNAE